MDCMFGLLADLKIGLNAFGYLRLLLLSIVLGSGLFYLWRFRKKKIEDYNKRLESYLINRYAEGQYSSIQELDKDQFHLSRENLFFVNIKYGLIAIVFSVVTSFVFFFAFRMPVSNTMAEWGQMGDFFGGMLNPILAFASFVALLYTIRIQSEELRLTRLEFQKSVAAQERMANESENQLSRQILLDDYRHIANQLRIETEELEELVKKPIETRGFPLRSEPPLNVEDFVGILCRSFYDNTNEQDNHADSVFNRAKAKYSEQFLQKLSAEGSKYFMDEIYERLRPVLRATTNMTRTISLHSEMSNLVPVNSGQKKIREADLRSAVRLLVFSYIATRTFNVTPYVYKSFVPSDPAAAKLFKEILLNLGLPSQALDIE